MFDLPLENLQNRFIMIASNSLLHRQYLSEIIENNYCCYICFSEDNVSLDDAKATLYAQYERLKNGFLPQILILDECDRLATDIQNDFFHSLEASAIPKIVLFSRQLLPSILDDPILSSLTEVISKASNFTEINDDALPIITVSGFGVGQVWVNGRIVDFSNNRLLHEFFFYVLEHQSVFREDALAEFWSGFAKKSAVNNFHVTRRKLNKLLGVEFLSYMYPHYQQNPNIILRYDVHEYRHQLETIPLDNANFSVLYQNIYKIYHHDFLSSHDSEWVIQRRNILCEQHSDICFNLAQSMGVSEQALGYYAQAFHFNPYREDVIVEMMKLYIDQNQAHEAIEIFHVLENNLKEREIYPNDTLQKLYSQAKVNPKTW